MYSEEISIKRRRFFIRALPFIPFILFIILFRKDVGVTLAFFWHVLLLYVEIPMPPFTLEMLFSLFIIGFNLFFGFFLFFLIWLFLISRQALLPVSSFGETIQTASQLVFYILRAHGPAVFVKDGKLRAHAEELHRNFPGVAVVDSNSALVLEQVSWAPRFLATVMDFLLNGITRLIDTISFRRSSRAPVRICGPGLTFIQYDERIQGVGDLFQDRGPVEELSGVVDLRRQFNISSKQSQAGPEMSSTDVRAYTRDGIELTTKVWILFSIGYEPDKEPNVLQIVFDGDQSLENLRIVSLGEKAGAIGITEEDDELDPEDRDEIYTYLSSNPALLPYAPVLKANREPVFEPNRVFSAVFGRAHSQGARKPVLPWMDMPVKVAIECFREIISHYNFDELYQPDAAGALKVNDLRKELRTRMRNSGYLSYRLIFQQRPDWPLILKEKTIFHNNRHLLASPVQSLHTSKLLRDRGIQVFAAGFADLVPTDEVYLLRLASWRAEWERDTKSARAAADLDAIRIYNRARARAQQDLALSFQEIFENGRYPREALALRVLQALEAIASDRETQRLLPGDTINMLRTIHDWLLPADIGLGLGGPRPPAMPPDQDEE